MSFHDAAGVVFVPNILETGSIRRISSDAEVLWLDERDLQIETSSTVLLPFVIASYKRRP